MMIICGLSQKVHASNKLRFLENLDEFLASSKPDVDDVISSTDNLKLHYVAFLHENAKATLLFYHGGGANAFAGYTKFAENLAREHMINVYLFDIRGHGMSEGRRGDCLSIESLWQDISSALAFVKGKHNGKFFVGGHSSGAGLLLNYMNWDSRDKDIDGLIFIAPQFGHTLDTKLENNNEPEFAEVSVIKIFLNRLTGGRAFAHDYAVFFNYDKKMSEKNSLVMAYTVNMALAVTPKDAEKLLKQLRVDTLILFSKQDELLDYKKLQKFLVKIHHANPEVRNSQIELGGHLTCLSQIDEQVAYFMQQPKKDGNTNFQK